MDQIAPGARQRNRLAILEHARRVLIADPAASLEDVAVQIGIVRRTVYGHFASRDELVREIILHSAAEFTARVEALSIHENDEDGLERLVVGAWGTVGDFCAVITLARSQAADALAEAMAPFSARIASAIAAGQAAGRFSDHLDASTLALVLETISLALLEASAASRWNGDAATVATTMLIALGVAPTEAQRRATAASQMNALSEGPPA